MLLMLDPKVRDALLEICQRECCGMDDLIAGASDSTPGAPLELALCLFAIQYFRPAAGGPVNGRVSEARYLC